ncbi:DUF2974 domain-containing protein [Streptococcus himalayensis]|uniref:Lipase n=1 Tax=Streptococcus himalayensis TaxID=1888195 RepID=A0A917EEI1_9STRE|nr:DUF2974 domain-containing protein [Streptococcus himalayensis]GGE31960.1 hypothetical protein GCM10011510_11560 [Streptococcus himalayensis]
MNNIFSYLEDIQHHHIYDVPFNALDCLILTELTYLDYKELVPQAIDQEIRLSDLADYEYSESLITHTKNRIQLFQEVTTAKRYKNLKLFAYQEDLDMEVEKQFAALTYKLKPDTYVIAFRGTDDSIIGWKEDFQMTYLSQIPAQKTATAYVEKVMTAYPEGQFILTGHSKGGNLAAYAASQISPALQDRITDIYSYDAPGLNRSVTQSFGYERISHLIRRYIPQGSLIGMMLDVPEQASIVKSTALFGLAQHNTFSWVVEGHEFLLLDTLNPDSIQVDQTLKNWVAGVSDEELKAFFDVFFGLILDAEITSINQLFKASELKKVSQILDNAKNLPDYQKEMLERLIQLLISMRYQAFLGSFKSFSFPSLFETNDTNELPKN